LNSWWQEFHDHIFSEPVHLFCIELMPDFQPTSEVIRLILKSDISSSNHNPDFLFSLPTEHNACPCSQGDCLQCSGPNLSIGI
jgi:hypothetical protein